MNAMNCARCGKVFSSGGKSICPNCTKLEEDIFKVVKEYIQSNPGSNMAQVSRETGVSIKRLTRYIREGRLEATRGMKGEVKCESCGKELLRGKFCDSCIIKMDAEIKTMFASENNNKPKKDTNSTHRMFIQKKL